MDIKMKFTINIPEEIRDMLGLDEDTLFVTSYENGILSVEPILDEEEDEDEEYEEEEDETEEHEKKRVNMDLDEFEKDLGGIVFQTYIDAHERGFFEGFKMGYFRGYGDGSNKRPYDDAIGVCEQDEELQKESAE